jgi:hypothetical protein
MIKHVVIEVGSHSAHPIRPEHINIDEHFFDAFNNTETEVSARWIVMMCQRSNCWSPFSDEDIETFYRQNSRFRNFYFNRLHDQGYIIKKDGLNYITHEFICKCFCSAPAKSLFPEVEVVA